MNLSPEDMFIQRRLSGIARELNGLIRNFEDFRQEHPTVIAPNVLDAIVGNLKDDVNIVMREMNLIGSPNRKQLKERRHVCRACHNVFLQPLVAGICDECRGRGITSADVAEEEKPDGSATEDIASPTEATPEDEMPGSDEADVERGDTDAASLENLPMIGEGEPGADPFRPGYFERPDEGESEETPRD